ncbi:hypothetical protein RFI_36559, partial [Reticulomyxa filosa]
HHPMIEEMKRQLSSQNEQQLTTFLSMTNLEWKGIPTHLIEWSGILKRMGEILQQAIATQNRHLIVGLLEFAIILITYSHHVSIVPFEVSYGDASREEGTKGKKIKKKKGRNKHN